MCRYPPSSSTSPTGCVPRRRCSGSTSPIIRCSASRRRCDAAAEHSIAEARRARRSGGGGGRRCRHGIRPQVHRKGDQMATFVLEDLDSAIEVTVFPRTLAEEGHKLADDAIVIVKGRVDRRDDTRVSVSCQTEYRSSPGSKRATLRRSGSASARMRSTTAASPRLKSILVEHPGPSPVLIELGPGKVLRLADDYRVDVDRAAGELRVAFGHDAVSPLTLRTRSARSSCPPSCPSIMVVDHRVHHRGVDHRRACPAAGSPGQGHHRRRRQRAAARGRAPGRDRARGAWTHGEPHAVNDDGNM